MIYTDLLIAAVCFLGFVLGILIANYTKEELQKGKPYFIILEIIILFTLGIAVLFPFNLIYFIIGIIVSYFLRKSYLYFGISLALSSSLLIPSLIFVYGLPSGSIERKKIFINLLLFFTPFLVFKFYPYDILSFCSGAFFFLAVYSSKNLLKNKNKKKLFFSLFKLFHH